MSHHGSDAPFPFGAIDKNAEEAMKKLQRQLQGKFPDGRLNPSDEGAVAVMVGHEKGKVVLSFPHPTAWIGFTPNQAMDIAQALITHARETGIVGVYSLKL